MAQETGGSRTGGRLTRFGSLILAAAALSACARAHDEISPAFVPPDAFAPATCDDLSLMRVKTERTLLLASLAQDGVARDDRTRTFGIPSLFGTIFEESREAEVAQLKGELQTIDLALIRKACLAGADAAARAPTK